MKHYLTICLLTTCGTIVDAAKNNAFSKEAHKPLSSIMCEFFTETLKENYEISNEADLYLAFFQDYKVYFESLRNNKDVSFLKVTDMEKLQKINDLLFIRDTLHYYQFYIDVEIFTLDSFTIMDKKNRPNNPYKVFIYETSKRNHEMIFDSFFDSHNVMMSKNFKEVVKNSKYETGKYLYDLTDLTGEIPFFFLSTYVLNTNCSEELKHREVRELIAVVFWKLLCIQAGIDFHANN